MAKSFFSFVGKDLTNLNKKVEGTKEKLIDGKLLTKLGLLVERQAKINATQRPGPRVQTNRLRPSIGIQLGPAPIKFVVIGTNVEYAPFLEFGTSKMGPFPFLNPAVESVRKQMPGEVGKFIVTVESAWGKK